MKNYSGTEIKSKLSWPFLILLFVGMHSILLGLFIYFFTDFFYGIFFGTGIENIFFVRQSGIFLFLAGTFYLYPLINLDNLYNLILLVIFSKTIAVIFLVSNAALSASPAIIYLAAFFDGLMGVLLVGVYFRLKVNRTLTNNKKIISDERISVKETA